MRSLALLVLLAGCTAAQGYHTGQAWQRSQCSRIPDKAEYDRCMASTGGSYDQYKRQAEAEPK
jgi:hypothetical protein